MNVDFISDPSGSHQVEYVDERASILSKMMDIEHIQFYWDDLKEIWTITLKDGRKFELSGLSNKVDGGWLGVKQI